MFERLGTSLLADAGIAVDGKAPHDFRVNDRRVFRRILLDPGMGFGESYMDGWWDCDRIDELVARLIRAKVDRRIPAVAQAPLALATRVLNLQSRRRSRAVAERHYDLEPALFEGMLDSSLTYTCAYWNERAPGLEEAQREKLDLLCRKLELKPGMRLLDIGCGFGGLMRHAAERYGASCVGYSLSREQTRLGRERCAGLPVEFVLEDYRKIHGRFDRIVSVEMIEAVGARNLRTFMETVSGALADDGVFALQTMGLHVPRATPDPWFHRYIFPNGMIPSSGQLSRAIENLFIVEDWQNLGPHYDRTLLEWNDRFQRAWPALARDFPDRFDARFKRMWELYLLSFAGSFRARTVNLWQVVMTKPGRAQPACHR